MGRSGFLGARRTIRGHFGGEAKQAFGSTSAASPGGGQGGEAGSGADGVPGMRRAAPGRGAGPPGDMRPGPLPSGMAAAARQGGRQALPGAAGGVGAETAGGVLQGGIRIEPCRRRPGRGHGRPRCAERRQCRSGRSSPWRSGKRLYGRGRVNSAAMDRRKAHFSAIPLAGSAARPETSGSVRNLAEFGGMARRKMNEAERRRTGVNGGRPLRRAKRRHEP